MAVDAMLVSKSAGTIMLSVDGTCSVISFIILYGLVPRNDLGKYCASMDDDSYSTAAVEAVEAAVEVAISASLEFPVVVP